LDFNSYTVPSGLHRSLSPLLQEIAWCQVGTKRFLEPMLTDTDHRLQSKKLTSVQQFYGFTHFPGFKKTYISTCFRQQNFPHIYELKLLHRHNLDKVQGKIHVLTLEKLKISCTHSKLITSHGFTNIKSAGSAVYMLDFWQRQKHTSWVYNMDKVNTIIETSTTYSHNTLAY